ncbi:type II secretion system protein E [Methanothermus fervidus DSM 2088]|uniref:Type II secretion system protein E n=1 Tax=Methanothermus fervidus (strain ATCC 43054 / DSM 2088 / JCM 10308 / V24 S) TaxID=523846 RepID=E3GY97_METFV|nr:CpaF family protein [Methanothermus fervidus]ADP77279.1 type II secretion system protein E [Methanothermus fervidus DSM 2088]
MRKKRKKDALKELREILGDFGSENFDEDIIGEEKRKKPLPEITKDKKSTTVFKEESEIEDLPKYIVKVPEFTKKEKELMDEIRDRLVDTVLSREEEFRIDKKTFKKEVKRFLKRRGIIRNVDEIAERITQEMLGYGKLDPLIKDDDLEDIMVIGVNKPVFVYHREKGMMVTNLVFEEYSELKNIIDIMARQVGRRIDQQMPILDARLPDGSRVNATIPPVSPDGPTLTIRKFRKDPFTIVDLINFNTLSSHLAAFLWVCVEGFGIRPCNAIIAGGTASGKTTTLNNIAAFIPPRERIITIEDTLELQLPHTHVVRMETRPPNIEGKGEIDMDTLVKNALRQRPDRIIVGEVRGKEATTLFTALNTGHSGFGTLHSNSARETITRLTNPPMNVPEIMIPALDFIIMQQRMYGPGGKSIRRVTEVVEITGMEEGNVQLNKLFVWNQKEDKLEYVGITSQVLREIADYTGMDILEIEEEIERRRLVLEYLAERNIRSLNEVGKWIKDYYRDPDEVLEKVL